MAQLIERSLPMPKVRGLNPVIGKFLEWTNFLLSVEKTKINKRRGRGCASVGRAVSTDTRNLQFESCHWQILFTINCFESVLKRPKIKKKRPGIAQYFVHKNTCMQTELLPLAAKTFCSSLVQTFSKLTISSAPATFQTIQVRLSDLTQFKFVVSEKVGNSIGREKYHSRYIIGWGSIHLCLCCTYIPVG